MADAEMQSRLDSESLLQSLQERADRLIAELRTFQSASAERGKQNEVEIRVFLRGVESEAKSLRTIAKRHFATSTGKHDNEDEDNLSELTNLHALKSSNLPFYEAVWDTAKTRNRVSALARRIHWSLPLRGRKHLENPGRDVAKASTCEGKLIVLIDVVAEDGLKWIKVSTVTNKRLLLEMAKEGWNGYGDYSSSDESDVNLAGKTLEQRNTPVLEVVQLATNLFAASRAQRVRFKHPTVDFVFTQLKECIDPDVDAAIADMRSKGVNVLCSSDAESSRRRSVNATSLEPDVLDRLLPSSLPENLVRDLNLDCTILLALISDISHYPRHQLPPSPANRSGSYHTAILRQISCEGKAPLLPNEVYPLICGPNLFCTSKAAERMYQIVSTMGTVDERHRADIFFGRGRCAGLSCSKLADELRVLSKHSMPGHLALPIKVIEFTDHLTDPLKQIFLGNPVTSLAKDDDNRSLATPSIADIRVASELHTKIALSAINTSVFLFGWYSGIPTFTSNKVVATSIIKAINELLDDDEFGFNSQHVHSRKSGMTSSNHTATDDKQKTNSLHEHLGGPQEIYQPSLDDAKESFQGPIIYICDTARSLIGKEKQASTN